MYSGADLKSEAFNEYCRWMRVKSMDPDTRREIQSMITNMDMIYERFSSRLSFGTAGLRAPLGAGTNRMNLYTVAAAARGFARWIKARGGADKGIVISYDSRNQSEAFAEMTARMAADEGVQVYLSDTLRPVPMLSYAINLYGAAGGVMITASHNPAEYNGFKAYGDDGAQLMPEAAAEVSTAIEQVGDIFSVINDSLTFRQLRHNGMIEYAGANLDYRYDNLILEKLKSDQVPEEAKKNLRIVYTPLNGAGNHHVRRLLGKLGFETVAVVPEQELPDGDFPSLRVPNPEYEDTFDKAIELAKVTMADLIIATDPDSDRLGVAVPDQDGEYCVLTGNQIGTLLMEYILGTVIKSRFGGADVLHYLFGRGQERSLRQLLLRAVSALYPVYSHEGQKLYGFRLIGAVLFHVRIYEVYLVELIRLELAEHSLCDLHCPVNRRILHGIEELAVHRGLVAAPVAACEVHSPDLSHNEEVAILYIGDLCDLVLGISDDIVVIAAAESLVRGYDDIALFALLRRYILTPVEVDLSRMRRMYKDILYSRLQSVEIRACGIECLSRLFQL